MKVKLFLLQQIINASSKDDITLADSVSPTALDHFKQSTKKLTEEKAETEALAAALAHISGATSVDQRSLINSEAVGVPVKFLTLSVPLKLLSCFNFCMKVDAY